MALTEIPQWGGASLFAGEVVDVITSYPRIGAACLASSLALYAYVSCLPKHCTSLDRRQAHPSPFLADPAPLASVHPQRLL